MMHIGHWVMELFIMRVMWTSGVQPSTSSLYNSEIHVFLYAFETQPWKNDSIFHANLYHCPVPLIMYGQSQPSMAKIQGSGNFYVHVSRGQGLIFSTVLTHQSSWIWRMERNLVDNATILFYLHFVMKLFYYPGNSFYLILLTKRISDHIWHCADAREESVR